MLTRVIPITADLRPLRRPPSRAWVGGAKPNRRFRERVPARPVTAAPRLFPRFAAAAGRASRERLRKDRRGPRLALASAHLLSVGGAAPQPPRSFGGRVTYLVTSRARLDEDAARIKKLDCGRAPCSPPGRSAGRVTREVVTAGRHRQARVPARQSAEGPITPALSGAASSRSGARPEGTPARGVRLQMVP